MNFINKEHVREILLNITGLFLVCSIQAAEKDVFPLITKRIQSLADHS